MAATRDLTMPYQSLSKVISPRLLTRIVHSGVEYRGIPYHTVERNLRSIGEGALATEMMRQLRQELNHKAG